MADRVRVLRVIEYVGDRAWVERTIARSVHGTIQIPDPNDSRRVVGEIRAATVGTFPEILDREVAIPDPGPGWTGEPARGGAEQAFPAPSQRMTTLEGGR